MADASQTSWHSQHSHRSNKSHKSHSDRSHKSNKSAFGKVIGGAIDEVKDVLHIKKSDEEHKQEHGSHHGHEQHHHNQHDKHGSHHHSHPGVHKKESFYQIDLHGFSAGERRVLDQNSSTLHRAAAHGDNTVLATLLGHKDTDLKQVDAKRRTALHVAAYRGHHDSVMMLVPHSCPNSPSPEHACVARVRVVRSVAAYRGHHDSVMMLVAGCTGGQASVVKARDATGRTAFEVLKDFKYTNSEAAARAGADLLEECRLLRDLHKLSGRHREAVEVALFFLPACLVLTLAAILSFLAVDMGVDAESRRSQQRVSEIALGVGLLSGATLFLQMASEHWRYQAASHMHRSAERDFAQLADSLNYSSVNEYVRDTVEGRGGTSAADHALVKKALQQVSSSCKAPLPPKLTELFHGLKSRMEWALLRIVGVDKYTSEYGVLQGIAWHSARVAVTGNLWWPLGFPNPRQTSKAIIKKLENTPKEHLNDMRMLQMERDKHGRLIGDTNGDGVVDDLDGDESDDENQDKCCANWCCGSGEGNSSMPPPPPPGGGKSPKGLAKFKKAAKATANARRLGKSPSGSSRKSPERRSSSASPDRRSLSRKGSASSSRRSPPLPRQASLDKEWEAEALTLDDFAEAGLPAARGRRGAGGREAGAGRKAEAGATRGAGRGRAKAEAVGGNASLAESSEPVHLIGRAVVLRVDPGPFERSAVSP
eukprot:CAMPEP_0172653502 /NCGR_PEP_ID=MMETSP1068-20121228/243859_1 /TAXON_ID=35684 /ORGANISM="Pseudopedinella elastica, Strain CCMP716" /LENGTH=707 /DNA_ID=CAMNT_0013467937 /DNA_START=107 /DNA_END=2232 /DNA_ORIENTATION=-